MAQKEDKQEITVTAPTTVPVPVPIPVPAPAPVAAPVPAPVPVQAPTQAAEEQKGRALPTVPLLPIAATSFSGRTRIKHLMENSNEYVGKDVKVCGWSRTLRFTKKVAFVVLSDGSGAQNLQVVITKDVPNYAELEKQRAGSCLGFKGTVVKSPGSKQPIELQIRNDPQHSITIYGTCPAEEYPLSKKDHSVEVRNRSMDTSSFCATSPICGLGRSFWERRHGFGMR
jgi:hypothetical protein